MKTPLQVKLQILTCTDCPLHQQCRTPVPMEVGSSETNRFVVVGEAPGRIEDYKGRPFVGPAGALLKRELKVAGLRPEAGVFMNVVSCWPKRASTTPTSSEIESCKGNLIDQLGLFPGVPVLLIGNTARKAVLPRAQMMYVLSRTFNIHGIRFFSAYHPAYIARNGSALYAFRVQLKRFADLVVLEKFDDALGGACLYCNARREDLEWVCRKHKTTWMKDEKSWKRKPGVQGTMF